MRLLLGSDLLFLSNEMRPCKLNLGGNLQIMKKYIKKIQAFTWADFYRDILF